MHTKHAQTLRLLGSVVILVTMALGVVYFMTLSQIESAEREERWAKQDAESAHVLLNYVPRSKAKRPC